jgi:hypothetical protein
MLKIQKKKFMNIKLNKKIHNLYKKNCIQKLEKTLETFIILYELLSFQFQNKNFKF